MNPDRRVIVALIDAAAMLVCVIAAAPDHQRTALQMRALRAGSEAARSLAARLGRAAITMEDRYYSLCGG